MKLAAAIHTTNEFFKFLNSCELYLGVKIQIKFIEKLDSSMVVSYNKKTAERLLVEKL